MIKVKAKAIHICVKNKLQIYKEVYWKLFHVDCKYILQLGQCSNKNILTCMEVDSTE